MRCLIVITVLATLAYAKNIQEERLSAYGYNEKYAIPLGEDIRKSEEAYLRDVALGRITGGSPSAVGQFPYQAGVLTSFVNAAGTGVCGGCLVSPDRVIYAAHCWFDGRNQGASSEIVLGSTLLFSGGTRLTTRNIIMHPRWNPGLIRDDVAVIILPSPVSFSDLISPIALPSGSQLEELFENEIATASGFGRTGDTSAGAITLAQSLSHVNLTVIPNNVCRISFPWNVVDSNICTSGDGGTSTCSGDSGGPLAIQRDGRPLLVGLTSFGSSLGCTLGFPAAFARITYFMSWFNEHL